MDMDRAIFEMNASVEATSLYILLCALGDEGHTVNLESAKERWNGSEQEMLNGVEELVNLGIVEARLPITPHASLLIKGREDWKWGNSN